MNKKTVKISALALTGVMFAMTCGCTSADDKKVLAKVNGVNITKAVVRLYKENRTNSAIFQHPYDMGDNDSQGALKYAEEEQLVLGLSNAMSVTLSDKEEKSARDLKRQFKIQKGGESEYQKYLKSANLKDSDIDDMTRAEIIRDKLSDQADKEITDDEKKEYFKTHYYRAKHVLLLTKDMQTGQPLDETKAAAAKQKADDILAQAKSGADFDTLMNENSEDPGSKSQPDGYVFTSGEMVAEFENCVKSLKVGEIGECESSFGYHVIKRLALDETSEIFDKNFDNVKSQLTASMLPTALAKWKDQYHIEVTEYQDQMDKALPAMNTEATPAPTPAPTQRARQAG